MKQIHFKEYIYIYNNNNTLEWKTVRYTEDYTTSGLISLLNKSISKDSLDLSKIKTIHFTSGCTVPRHKLKDFNKTHNLSVVRDPLKANVIISSKKSISNLVTTIYNSMIYSKDSFLKSLESYDRNEIEVKQYNGSLLNIKMETNKLIEYIKNSNSELVIINDYAMGDWINNTFNSNYEKGRNFCVVKESNIPDINNLCTSTNIYPESEILKHLNMGPTIDTTMYNNIKDMINSPDRSNLIVAMEVMANCNYDESIVYISLLFREFYKIKLRGTEEKNHVNFKSLITYLAYPNLRFITLDNILGLLVSKNLLTRNNLNILLDVAYKEYKHSGDSEYFKITRVEVPEDILARVIENEKLESESICIEKSESGECLMSAKMVELDFNSTINTK